MPLLRRAAVAGSWYPANPARWRKSITTLPAGPPVAGDPLASSRLAGLLYSGPIAAHSYKLLAGRDIEVVVLVGPSHFVGFEGVAICESGAFDTPLGAIPIDQKCAASIALASGCVREHPTAHVREHSLEMQLPFLKRVLPNASIVPLVMGFQRRRTVYALSDALVTGLKGRRAALVASSDLSHHQRRQRPPRWTASWPCVEQFDPTPDVLLEDFPEHACGGGPMVSVMRAAKALGARDARVLKYGDSGDVSGDKDAVVGYLAAAFGSFM
jgi:AmmeMemoRadiSam system protein B